MRNYEYKKYLLPQTLQRVWFYAVVLVSAFPYVAQISHGKKPGEVPEDGGGGNKDFNDGLKKGKSGYEVQVPWKLAVPLKI